MELPKLPDINFKVVLQKLSVFKNNISLLVAVIIAVLSVLLFIPTHLISSGLKKQVQQTSINQLDNKIRQLLRFFESPEQWKFDDKRLESLVKDANDIENLAKQTTRRKFLSKDVFSIDPNSSTFSSLIFTQFGRLYYSEIDRLITAGKSGVCITKDEIDSTIRSTITDSSRVNSTGVVQSQISRHTLSTSSILSTYTTELEWVIIDQLCQQRAKSISYYADPLNLGGYKYLKNYAYQDIDTAMTDCWFYQLAYWVIEDIAKTIDKMNSKSENVLVAPVKRLMEISFNTGILRNDIVNFTSTDEQYSGGRTSSGTTEDRPNYVVLPKDGLTDTCTARYCNDDIDVIHFRVKFVISIQALFELMRELCSSRSHVFIDESGKEHQFEHNQITILETSFKPIEPLSASHELYRYGQGSVAELDMVCEYVFVKKGYEDIKPETVKLALSKKIKQ